MSNTRLRSSTKIKAVIVEDHNMALYHIHRAIAERYLAYDNVPIVHLDSHPDLGVPEEITADVVYDKNALYRALDIENWLLPAVYAGHVQYLLWIKPQWSHQISDGDFQFYVGKCPSSGKMRVTCEENYFLVDGFYKQTFDLMNRKLLNFSVRTMDTDHGMSDQNVQSVASVIKDTPYVFDIDLDFFSTMNPFVDTYSCDQMHLLQQLFQCSIPEAKTEKKLVDFSIRREKYLSEMRSVFSSLSKTSSLKDSDIITRFSEHTCILLEKLVNTFKKPFDSSLLYNTFLTCDMPGLPHHISSDEEISRLTNHVADLLGHIPKPTLITVARSSIDDYCPKHQVDFIQGKVIKMLSEVLPNVDVIHDYEVDPDKNDAS